MPAKTMVLNIVSIILQYSLLALIYFFLIAVLRGIYMDLKQSDRTYTEHPDEHSTVCNHSRLIVIDKQDINFPFDKIELKDATSIGRSISNDIVIDDRFVSHEHACINFFKNEYWLSDLNSTNHTYLNGNRVQEDIPLNNGDIIKIGPVTFKYER